MEILCRSLDAGSVSDSYDRLTKPGLDDCWKDTG